MATAALRLRLSPLSGLHGRTLALLEGLQQLDPVGDLNAELRTHLRDLAGITHLNQVNHELFVVFQGVGNAHGLTDGYAQRPLGLIKVWNRVLDDRRLFPRHLHLFIIRNIYITTWILNICYQLDRAFYLLI